MNKTPLYLAVVATSLLGCSEDSSDIQPDVEQRVGTAQSKIAGGTIDSTSTAVVGVVHATQFGVGGCTGSLLSPNLVLTALHCVANTPDLIECPSSVFSVHNAIDMYVTTETSFPGPTGNWKGVSEIVQPEFSGLCGRDVAILILTSPISPSEAVPLLPRIEPLQPMEIYSAVGFGQQGEGGPSGTRYRRDNLELLCVGNMCGAPQFVYPKEWVGETGVCSGDSGGPAFDAEGRVTGVASRGAAMCDQPLYGDVQQHLEWIKATTVYAADKAGIEPPTWATQTDGTGGGGVGGGSGTGGGGVGGSSSSGNANGYVPGEYQNKDFEGDLVGSCALAPGSDSSDWAFTFAGLGLMLVARRRRDS